MRQSNWLEDSIPLPSVTRIKPVTRSWQSTGRQRPSSQTFASLQRQIFSPYAQMDFLSLLLASPAKTLALQENKLVTMESEVYCFMKSSVLLGSFDLTSSCLKTLEIYSLTKTGRRSKKPSFRLPKQGTMQNGQLFQQVMWEPVTAGSESGLLRTPTTGMVNQDRSQDPSYMSKLLAKGQTVTLAAQVKSKEMALLPTPTVYEPTKLTPSREFTDTGRRKCTNHGTPGLTAAQNSHGAALVEKLCRYPMLPTPTTRDWKDGSQQACCNTPPNGLSGREIHHAQDSPLNGPPMYLAPSFVEEMMGYPIGWTDLNN